MDDIKAEMPMTPGYNPYGAQAIPFTPQNPFQQGAYPYGNMAPSGMFPTSSPGFQYPALGQASPNLNVHAQPFEVPTATKKHMTPPPHERSTSSLTTSVSTATGRASSRTSVHRTDDQDVTSKPEVLSLPPHLRAARGFLPLSSKDSVIITVKLFRCHDLSINSPLIKKIKLDEAFNVKEVITALGGNPREEELAHLKAEMSREGVTFKLQRSYRENDKQTVKDLGWREGECLTLFPKVRNITSVRNL